MRRTPCRQQAAPRPPEDSPTSKPTRQQAPYELPQSPSTKPPRTSTPSSVSRRPRTSPRNCSLTRSRSRAARTLSRLWATVARTRYTAAKALTAADAAWRTTTSTQTPPDSDRALRQGVRTGRGGEPKLGKGTRCPQKGGAGGTTQEGPARKGPTDANQQTPKDPTQKSTHTRGKQRPLHGSGRPLQGPDELEPVGVGVTVPGAGSGSAYGYRAGVPYARDL